VVLGVETLDVRADESKLDTDLLLPRNRGYLSARLDGVTWAADQVVAESHECRKVGHDERHTPYARPRRGTLLLDGRPDQLDQQLPAPEEALAALRIAGANRAGALADETKLLKNRLCLGWRVADHHNVVNLEGPVWLLRITIGAERRCKLLGCNPAEAIRPYSIDVECPARLSGADRACHLSNLERAIAWREANLLPFGRFAGEQQLGK